MYAKENIWGENAEKNETFLNNDDQPVSLNRNWVGPASLSGWTQFPLIFSPFRLVLALI